ncbi:MAG: DNA repair protein RecN [Desulfobacterales bacterium]|jgi:DNA repair protein RecN (Recombination protein N)|nr:DNA repair protein RecN [Desulfobacteraceae bacterium]MBT4363962.1 DNA repair protein RecN [Desulfobacteraceae bacterium]MBT7085161.1 DNA repair protein RecN [Desulfobacterales bacterium]MBT7696399.1 DNA repair protein RecN [Desulfobacterales bacterium]
MLSELTIRNFAIIDDIKVCFSKGLTILSGETGAGKSIIINAVNLILGNRATSKLIRTGAQTAELEAMFHISPESRAAIIMQENDFDPSEGLIVRRIISRNDRHKIYINGRLSTIQSLTSITENLASISGQHAHQGLLKEEQHLIILDQFGGLTSLRNMVYDLYHEIIPLVTKLNKLRSFQLKQVEHVELLEFQKTEILNSEIFPDEDVELEKERILLKNSEAIFIALNESIEELYSSNGSIHERLVGIKNNLSKVGRFAPDLMTNSKEVDNVSYHIEDITENLRKHIQNIHIDENRLEAVEARIDKLIKLKRKYGGSLYNVFNKLNEINNELSEIENIDDQVAGTEKILDGKRDQLVDLVIELSAKRKSAAEVISKEVENELGTLEMPETSFNVALSSILKDKGKDEYLSVDGNIITESGIDKASFLIAPNVGEDLKPLANIASGGELSRVVLAIKAILAKTESLETLVFDEVDAGIGGGVAEVVGKKLSSLSEYHQIICITHLAQIAKFGSHHFRISKHITEGRTKTEIKQMLEDERVEEIARMIGGQKITHATRDHAREILKSA